MQPLFLFKILGIPFFSYSTLIGVGLVFALVAAFRSASRVGDSLQAVAGALTAVSISALIMGRILHLFYNFDYFMERPSQILRYTDGGMSFFGVFCGGCLGLWLWSNRTGVPFACAADKSALPTAILVACAWLGAFMHGSQYGAPVENALALELRDTFGVIVPRWPTQLLAALWSALLGLGLIVWENRQCRKGITLSHGPHGARAAMFLVFYSSGLCLLDFTRGDQSIYILGFRLTQWLYLVLFGIGVFNLGRRL